MFYVLIRKDSDLAEKEKRRKSGRENIKLIEVDIFHGDYEKKESQHYL